MRAVAATPDKRAEVEAAAEGETDSLGPLRPFSVTTYRYDGLRGGTKEVWAFMVADAERGFVMAAVGTEAQARQAARCYSCNHPYMFFVETPLGNRLASYVDGKEVA